MNFRSSVLLILLSTLLSACRLIEPSPAASSGFLAHDDKLAPLPERAPFNAGYIPDGKRLDNLKKVYHLFYFPPIEVLPLQAKLKDDGLSPSEIEDRLSDAQELGNYLHERLKVEFANNNIVLSDTPTENQFIWEIAIVELRPTLAALNVAATTAGFFIPGAGLVQRLGSGSIAIEGIIRDGKTGDILAEFKDRKADKNALFSVRDYQQYSHARHTMDEWAEVFAKLASTTQDVKVEGSLPVTLNPF